MTITCQDPIPVILPLVKKMLGERLRKARERAGRLQIDVAVASNKHRTLINKVEQGNSSLSVEALTKVAVELGVSTDYLLGLTDDPTPMALLQQQGEPGCKLPLDAPTSALTPVEIEALSIVRDLRSPLLEGWLRSGEALLELQRQSP